MHYAKITFTSLLMTSLILSGCAGMTNRQKNEAAGAAVGGVAGALLTGGSAFGTVGGAAIGGVIGHGVDQLSTKKK
jgi:osmotically inducible lipoprotein OsmB